MEPPIASSRLNEIANEACSSALSSAEKYEHAQTEAWNTAIINKILESLVSETTSKSETGVPGASPYKFAVNSTIIQHLNDPTKKDPGSAPGTDQVGRRGMHSAAGAYWNNDKDGMWNFKYEGAEAKGLDVVINLMWIAV